MKNNKLNTFIVSDLHLADSETNSNKPLWKKFKSKEYFFDQDFSDWIDSILNIKNEPKELILNGDIFDFDSTLTLPKNKRKFPIKKYEYSLGLNPMEEKSVFKIEVILKEHKIWTDSIVKFIKNGNRVVFIIGNHDIELCWPSVQNKILELFNLTEEERKLVTFCEWFYISNKDTLIEHGHQYDPYCLTLNPINPIIRKNGIFKVRLPFGNLATRFMINAMGFRNPYNEKVYVGSFWDFVKFYIKYELKNQPLIVFTWFFGALKTLLYSIGESFIPSQRDPQTFMIKLNEIAKKSNSTIDQVLQLRENHAHPAVRKPSKIIQELWLDRAFFLMGILFISWQIFTTSALFAEMSIYWFLIPLIIFTILFTYYAHGISTDIHLNQNQGKKRGVLSCKICNVKRIILGHTHFPEKKKLKDNIEYLNSGTWSYYFQDIECTNKINKKHFIWIKGNEDKEREANLLIWENKKFKIIK
jgi:UDP-2,3-diacylglucosamine pyrophosphatase LpxH